MAHRWLNKVKSKVKRPQQAAAQEPALTHSPPTPSPAPSWAASKLAIRAASQPTPSLPTSTESETSPLPSIQERLWNQAYDELKESEAKLVKAYERILSAELDRNDSSFVVSESTEYEIGKTREERCRQMQQLVQGGLDRTQKQASIKRRIDEGLQAVQSVRGIVDKAVQASPEAAVAWVGVCLGLEIISNPVTEARDNRKGIIYVLSRMDWYWNLVCLLLDKNKAEQSSAGLQVQLEKHIVQLYQKILLYQVKSICLYHRKWAAVIGRDMFKVDDWAGQLGEIKEAEAAVQRDMEQYNTEESKIQLRKLTDTASALEMNLQDIHSAIQDQTRQQEKRHQDDKDKQCLKDLRETDPRDDKTRIQDTKGGLLRDSYRWILHNHDFQRWRDDPQSQLLWIKGDPGKGKTMLLCGILDELGKESDTCLSYFFCQATEARLSNATVVLRGLIYLLVEQQPSLISYVRERYDHAGKQTFEDVNAWEALSKILAAMLDDPSLTGAILIVDALDECKTNRHQLLDFITKPSRVKWIVSSRNSPDIEERLDSVKQKVKLHLEGNNDSISAAVRIYIRHKVDALAERKKYDDETRDIVEQHLVSSANDTFLWVALVCQELQTTDIWDVRDVIEKIPAGLEALYDRMIWHIQSLERRNPEMCRQILSTVAVAYRPLRLEELGQLSALPSNIQRSIDHISKIISMCGSFLTMRNNVVYIIHQSAKDFLLLNPFLFSSDISSGIAHQHNALFLRSLGALSETLRRDIYHINAPGLSIEEVSPPDPNPLTSVRYSCVHWVDHLYDSNSTKRINEKKDLQDGGVVHEFIQKKYLYWLESLSLLRSMPDGVTAMHKLEALEVSCYDYVSTVSGASVRRTTETRQLAKLLRDARRFILSHKSAIEIAPLQVYASGLVFSPKHSLIRELFQKEEPSWMVLKPRMEVNWKACLQTLEGHSGSVSSVASSADGQLIASGSHDGTVRIWDAATGECRKTLEGYNSWVTSVMFSADGQRIASGLGDGTVQIWDVAIGKCQRTFRGHSGLVTSITFSACGQRIASASEDYTVKIWDAVTGKCQQTLEGHTYWVTSVSFSADSQQIALGSSNGIVKIWDIITGKYKHTLKDHSRSVKSVAFSVTGQWIASGSDDNTVKIWNTATGECLYTLEGHRRSVTSVAFSADGQRIASGSGDRLIKVWNTVTGECRQTLEGHGDWVTSVVFSADGQRIASGSDDNTIKIWDCDAAMGKRQQTIEGHNHWVTSVVFSADGQRIASGSHDGTVKIWDTATGECQKTLEGRGYWVSSVMSSADSQRIASGLDGGTAKIWDMAVGEHNGRSVISFAFSADGQRIASGSADGIVKIWDAVTGECHKTLEDYGRSVRAVMFSADGQRIVSGSDDNIIKIWDVATGECQTLEDHNHWVRSVAFSADSQQIALGLGDGAVKIWDVATGECQQTLEDHGRCWVTSVIFSADGQRLASGLDDGTIKIWDVATGECQQILKGHGRYCWVTSVSFSADGQRIASGLDDGIVKIWDVATGECQQTLEGHGRCWVTSLVFSADGQRIASGSADRTVKIWNAVTGECQQTVEAGRVLTPVSFDPTTDNRLYTNHGPLNLDPSSAISQQSPEATSGGITHSGYGISGDGMWIMRDGRSMLWLPPEYRATISAVVESTVAIGCRAGRVLVMKFSQECR